MRKRLNVLLLPALLALTPVAVQAEEKNLCLDRSEMVSALVDQYGEQLAEVHEVKGQGLIEFHIDPDSGNWTMLLTKAGTSCVLAAGTGLVSRDYAFLEPELEV